MKLSYSLYAPLNKDWLIIWKYKLSLSPYIIIHIQVSITNMVYIEFTDIIQGSILS